MKYYIFLILVVYTLIGCYKDVSEVPREFGKAGSNEILHFTLENNEFSSIYYPKDFSLLKSKAPVIFLASGWFSEPQKSITYESLITFMVSHGAVVIYTYEGAKTSAQHSIDGYNEVLASDFVRKNIWEHVDTNKIGVVGHSAGGGLVFKIMDYYSKVKKYGSQGRFIMALDPWFAFDMDSIAMKNLPQNTNTVIVKFGVGGNNDADGTDARIPLTEFYLLESIDNKNKDYQIFENADHAYPKGERPFSEMQGILKPLDALMEYTFVNQSEGVRKTALENGNDDPYGSGIQVVKSKSEYAYPCDGAQTLIDYCKIVE